jgi:type III restriction enzyme
MNGNPTHSGSHQVPNNHFPIDQQRFTMSHHVSAISSRLSLRHPQQTSLEILEKVCEDLPLEKETKLKSALATLQEAYPHVTSFERDFPSLCFALATGVGKTRLMGAFITYLHLAHKVKNFFVLAPNLTIYSKLIADFTPNTPKYVFKGIAEFAINVPYVITGDNYENTNSTAPDRLPSMDDNIRINVFNISKIIGSGKDVRKLRKLSEYIGESYFDYLSNLDDLVILMDESHRYRAKAGMKAINELKPVLGLELTATPFVESTKGKPTPFKNVIYDYSLARAIEDGYVKEPAVATRKDFNPKDLDAAMLETIKLEDGIRLHEQTKVQLETYARQHGKAIVKPFVLIIARDTTHAKKLLDEIKSEKFFEGRYREKVIQVDSSQTGADEEKMISRLLQVENPNEPTEIVIHVNMLKEGWDVTNLYTIIPLRAANARTLIEQSIGRGLRLPYGKRTGVDAVDRLSIVAHDKFQEIVDEANKGDSIIQMQQIILDPEELKLKKKTVVSGSNLSGMLGADLDQISTAATENTFTKKTQPFKNTEEEKVAKIAYEVIKKYETKTTEVQASKDLITEKIQLVIVAEVKAQYMPQQMDLKGISNAPNISNIVAQTANLVVEQTIDIPRITVYPVGEVASGFNDFTLDLSSVNYPPVTDEIWQQSLKTGLATVIGLSNSGIKAKRLADYIVMALIDYNDISYEDHSNLLYDLAKQTIAHLKIYIKDDEDIERILKTYRKNLSELIHTQMQDHYWEDENVEYTTKINRSFTELKQSVYTVGEKDSVIDHRLSPPDKSNFSKYLFGAFSKCLYALQKFDSNAERLLSIILERESEKWFKPAKGQFQIFYNYQGDHPEYVPDFVAETADCIYMLEPKSKKNMSDEDVIAKKEAAEKWCATATHHNKAISAKPWKYKLIQHDTIAENMSIDSL